MKVVHRELTQEYGRHATDAVMRRHAKQLAVLDMALQLMRGLGVPTYTKEDPMKYLLKASMNSAVSADQPLMALQSIVDWAASNQSMFWGRHETTQGGRALAPPKGWAGGWPPSGLSGSSASPCGA